MPALPTATRDAQLGVRHLQWRHAKESAQAPNAFAIPMATNTAKASLSICWYKDKCAGAGSAHRNEDTVLPAPSAANE